MFVFHVTTENQVLCKSTPMEAIGFICSLEFSRKLQKNQTSFEQADTNVFFKFIFFIIQT